MKRLTVLLLAAVLPTWGQATYTLNSSTGTYPSAASGLGIYPPSRYYMPLYDNLLANIGSAVPTQRDMIYSVASGTTTGFTGVDSFDQVASNQAVGWTVNVRCHYSGAYSCAGGANGYTGTVTANTTASQTYPGTGAVYTITPAPSSAIAAGDSVELIAPVTGINPTANGWAETGSGTFAYDTLTGHQAPAVGTLPAPTGCLQVTGSSGGATNLYTLLDGVTPNNTLMNGTVTQSVLASLQSGALSVTMTAYRNGGSSFISSSAIPLSGSAWAAYTATGTASETGSAPTGTILVQYAFTGTGTACLSGMSLTGEATNGGAWTHTNSSPFSDQMVLDYQAGGYDEVRYNYASGSAIPAGSTLINLLQPTKYRLQSNVSDQSWNTAGGLPAGIDDIFKFAKAAGVHRVKIAVPPTFTAADYTHLADYTGGACAGSTFAQYRCDLGQTAPWTGVFTSIEYGWNETWNSNSTGQYLGGSPYYTAIPLAVIAAAALEADGNWNRAVEKFSVPMQPYSGNGGFLASGDPTGTVDYIDSADYYQMSTTTCTEPLMFQNLMAEAYGNTVDSSLIQYGIGFAGNKVSNYETAFGAVSGACTVAGVTGLPDGLGGGIADALIPMYLQRKWPGVFMHWNSWVTATPAAPYSSTAGSSPATSIPMWAKFPNIRGIGANPSANVYAAKIMNACAILGTGFTPTGSGVPTLTTTAANGIPSEVVPLTPMFAFKGGGTSRCYVLVNLDSSSHTFTLTGPDALVGTVGQLVYASVNGTPGLQDNNEAVNTTPTVSNTASTISAASTYTVGPYSMVALSGSTATVSGGVAIP